MLVQPCLSCFYFFLFCFIFVQPPAFPLPPPALTSSTADLTVDTVYFSTWFGGGDASWAPSKTTYALFRNMRIYTYDDPGQTRVPPNAMAQSASQTVVTTRIDEPEF